MFLRINNKNMVHRLAILAAVVTVLLSVLTMFDEYNKYLELFSHFRLQYLWISLILLVILLIQRQRKSSMVMIGCLVLNATLVMPWYLEAGTVSKKLDIHDLKIIHSNVFTPNTSYQKLVDMVYREKPDILLVQEVDSKWINGIKKVKKILPYYKEYSREDNFGIAIYSKYPFHSVEKLYVGNISVPSIKATIYYGKKLLTLFSTHAIPPIGFNNYENRNQQIMDLAKRIRKIETPLILVGDLNITMWSSDYKPLVMGTKLENARKGFGIIPTWPVNYPFARIPIDQCLISNDIKVSDIRPGPDIGSDHFPLIVSLRPNW